jgi:hypothetical protein
MYTDPFGKEHRYGPPAGWVQPAHQSLGPEDWDALVERGLQFEPYDGETILSTTSGNCLAPLLVGGNHYLKLRALDADEQLVDGGLYVVKPEDQEAMRRLIRERLGIMKTGTVTIAKFLRFASFEWWCVNREGIDKLGMGYVTHQVVGVITFAALAAAGCGDAVHAHAHPCGNPFDVASPICSEIGLNAVSTIGSANSATNVSSAGATINVSTNTTVISLAVTTTGQPIEVDASCTAWVGSTTGGSLGQAEFRIFRDGTAVTGATADLTQGGLVSLNSSSTLTGSQVTLVVTDAPAAGSHSYALVMTTTFHNSGSGTANLNASNNFIKVREIKR